MQADERRIAADERSFGNSPVRLAHSDNSFMRSLTTMNPVHRSRGFTLIELMIAVAIVALLVSVALPWFLDSMRKSRRSDAVASLQAIALAQERFRTNHSTYAGNLPNAPTASTDPGLNLPEGTANGYYALSLANASETGYSALASPVSGKSQAGDGDCAYLRVRLNGGTLLYGASADGSTFNEGAGNRCWSK
jgi:type IV pilus assembly protein PilE